MKDLDITLKQLREKKIFLKQTGNSCRKLAQELSNCQVDINDVEANLPRLKKQIQHAEAILPILIKHREILRLSLTNHHKSGKEQEMKIYLLNQRAKLLWQLKEIDENEK